MMNLSRVVMRLLFGVLFFTIFLFSFLENNAQTETLEPLIIEIQISGEKSTDDYIKIYNPTESDIYLGNYKGSYLRLVKRTKTSSKDYSIKSWSEEPEAKIPSKGFYIWANKDYTTLTNVDSFTSQTIAANNGIALRMGPMNTGVIIDAVGWGDFGNVLFEGISFPDNPTPNQKLKRKQIDGIYQDTNNNSQDFYLDPPSQSSLPKSETPSTENLPEQKIQPEPGPQTELEELKSTILQQGKPETKQTYSLDIVINEILPSPKGPDAEEEWIEIFNQGNSEVNLSDWKISDTIGKIVIYTIPQGTKISPKGFLVFSRPITKITLNNDGDGINLIQPDGNIIDSMIYEKAPLGQSYNRIFLSSGEQNWFWSNTLTPGLVNIISAVASETEKAEPIKEETTKEPAQEKNVNIKLSEKELAVISEQITKENSYSLFTLLIALLVAISSGIIILVLRRKQVKYKNQN